MGIEIAQAVISAGGFGTRLKPFTDTHPKPMIPVLGKPLLEWHIEQFKKHGVRQFIFTLHHLPEVVTYHFQDGARWGVHIEYAVEKVPLGSAGGLKLIENKLQDRFFYIYGDTFSLMNYSEMKDSFFELDEPLGMQRVQKTAEYADADIVELDGHNRMIQIHAKPHTRSYEHAYRMRGSFVFEKEICSFIPQNVAADLAKDTLPKALGAHKNLYGYECNDYSKGIDTKDKLSEVETYLRSKKIEPWW